MVMPYCHLSPSHGPLTNTQKCPQRPSSTHSGPRRYSKALTLSAPGYLSLSCNWRAHCAPHPLNLSYQEQIDKQKNTVTYYHPGTWRAQQMNTYTHPAPTCYGHPGVSGALRYPSSKAGPPVQTSRIHCSCCCLNKNRF